MFAFIKKTLAFFGISTALLSAPMIALAFLNPPIFMALMGLLNSILAPLIAISGTLINGILVSIHQGIKVFLGLPPKYKVAVVGTTGIGTLIGLHHYTQKLKEKYQEEPQTLSWSENGYLWFLRTITLDRKRPDPRSASGTPPTHSTTASQPPRKSS